MSTYKEEQNRLVRVGFDVDGTLIRFDDTPRYDIIDILLQFKRLGCSIVVASGGGKEYAQHWVHKLGLTNYVDYVTDKYSLESGIKVWFDDEKVSIGETNIIV